MARTATKRNTKPSSTKSVSQSTTSATSRPSVPDAPFEPLQPPSTLLRFAGLLPTNHVYLIHLDRTPYTLRRRVFLVPCLMNLVITLLLAVRLYYAAPVYLDQIITIFGYDTPYKVNPSQMGLFEIADTVTSRTGLLFLDYVIFGVLGSWPWEFCFGSRLNRHVGPVEWRSELGFKTETEIIVRRSRKWDMGLVLNENADDPRAQRAWTNEDDLTVRVKVEPAMARARTSKTGYLLLDKDWDLDFKGMLDAHTLVKNGRVTLQELEHIALVHFDGKWYIWRFESPRSSANAEPIVEDAEVTPFRKVTKDMRLEEVFYRWIEMVQYETSLPGGFSAKKQDEALDDIRTLVEEKGADWEVFLERVGGKQNLPGISKTSQRP